VKIVVLYHFCELEFFGNILRKNGLQESRRDGADDDPTGTSRRADFRLLWV
jgi:hypothetical protein